MTLNYRVDLTVPFVEKENAKALGARWDQDRRVWYAPPGIDLATLQRWLPQGFTPAKAIPAVTPAESEKGMSLINLLALVRGAIERDLSELVWVRAEISELRRGSGHLYLELAERNDRGDVVAQARAAIWKSRVDEIDSKFRRATGEGLRDNIKILCQVRVRFDVLHGFRLIIEDVDPSYTLGDLAAKLARIREHLQREGLYHRNKRLTAPTEYVRVAVISPTISAGLGDFRHETDRLQAAGLCHFHFYPATFQGIDAPSSLRNAVNEVLEAHRQRPFDALAIIRGGGSVTDLAWLNDLELARLLCLSPIPVLTGIGHERDETVLDEIAHRRFDTPSKVALHIATLIKDNALAALADLDRVRAQVNRIVDRERTTLTNQVDRVRAGASSLVEHAKNQQRSHAVMIRTTARLMVRAATQSLTMGRANLTDGITNAFRDTDVALARLIESAMQLSRFQLTSQGSELERLIQAVTLKTQLSLQATNQILDQFRSQAMRDASNAVVKAAEVLDGDHAAVLKGSSAILETARREIEGNARLVVGLGPRSTLRRGFALARDHAGRPVTSREAAMRLPAFRVEFHDGQVAVTNPTTQGRDTP